MLWLQTLADEVKEVWGIIKDNAFPLVLFGAGDQGVRILDYLRTRGIDPICFCDNNKTLHQKDVGGLEVVSYETLKSRYQNYLLLITVSTEKAVLILNQIKSSGDINKVLHFRIPFKVEDVLLSVEDIVTKSEYYENIYNSLTDDLSKELFTACLKYKCTGNGFPLFSYINDNSFFDKTILPNHNDHIYVDVGAYTGDTLISFYAFCGGKYKKSSVVEPNEHNVSILETIVKYGNIPNVEVHQKGAWNQKGELRFYTYKGTEFFNSNFFHDAANMRNRKQVKYTEEGDFNSIADVVAVDTLDNMLHQEPVTIMKVNPIGADFMALQGASSIIKTYKPAIIVDYGSKLDDLTNIPIYLKSLRPDYNFYIRQKLINNDSKTVFYAI